MAINTKRRRVIEEWLVAHQMVPEQLDKTSMLLRDTYISCRRAAYPNYYLNSTKHPIDFWRKAAMFIIDNKLDLPIYVRAIFAEYGPSASPTLLLSYAGVNIYHKRADTTEHKKQLMLHLALYTDKVQQRLTENRQTLEEILCDSRNSFDPVFVYCMALANKLPVIAADIRQSAMTRLNQAVYRELYTAAFPGVLHVDNK